MSKFIPADYKTINRYNGSFNVSQVHCGNNALVRYFGKYLLQKAISVLKWNNVPETWDFAYLAYGIYTEGYEVVFNTDKFGVIPQICTLSGYNVFYRPTTPIVSNPLINTASGLRLGVNCELVYMQPDYSGIMDIISYYSDLLGLCIETASINLMNSKLSYIVPVANKAAAESLKKIYDQVNSGQPLVVYDKALTPDDPDKPLFDFITQNVGGNYIAGDIISDMRKIEAMFDTDIGIQNANTDKKERLISAEVESNNESTCAKLEMWLETLNNSLAKVNNMFGLNISVERRFVNETVNTGSDTVRSDTVESGNISGRNR